MLDDRKAAILRAVVREYIETAQPVGSTHVARSLEVQVSPATVRNDMAVLEQEGYVHQPHTSAGRVPTDKGYRFFVDSMGVGPGTLDAAQHTQVSEFFASAHGAIERMLLDTTRLLSGLTDYAAVVVGPPHEDATIRSVQLVGLGGRTALVVAVLSNGVVEKSTIEVSEDTTHEQLEAASRALGAALIGGTLARLPDAPVTGDAALDDLSVIARASLAGAHRSEADQVFVGGVSRMAQAFDAVDTVRQVLAILEQQYVVVGLLRDVLDRGLSVAIGAEHGFEPLAGCSVVVAPYEVEGEVAGSIGVVGPTRMHYPQALAAVAVVSQRLGRRLSEG
jgi:heat-inducible transcriptional repressor